VSGFDWDEENIAHIARHNVTVKEVEEVLDSDPEYFFVFTQDGEKRYLALGVTKQGRLLTVAYTERADRLRPITAWAMTRKEKRFYDSEKIRQQK